MSSGGSNADRLRRLHFGAQRRDAAARASPHSLFLTGGVAATSDGRLSEVILKVLLVEEGCKLQRGPPDTWQKSKS